MRAGGAWQETSGKQSPLGLELRRAAREGGGLRGRLEALGLCHLQEEGAHLKQLQLNEPPRA